jgi:hypothetical protein
MRAIPMQTKKYEVVTLPGAPLEDMAELIEDAYIEANIAGGQIVGVHCFGDDARSTSQRGLFVVVEYPLETSLRRRVTARSTQ